MSKEPDKFLEDLAKAKEKNQKIEELKDKKLLIEERRVTNELDRIARDDEELKIAKTANFDTFQNTHIEKLLQDNADYLEAAKYPMRFINKSFDNKVPFFRKNIILIGGLTGKGKSTTVANIVLSTISQKNKKTGEYLKVLVITNEEAPTDFYNRVTCLINGWNYVNHDKFTPEQINAFQKMIPILCKDGRLTVIDNNYNGSTSMTTSIEGIQNIMDTLLEKKIYYDVIIIDYYQNISRSIRNPKMEDWQVNRAFAKMIDTYKNIYPAPIVLMSQLKPGDREEPIETRMHGGKSIVIPSTFIMELNPEAENYRTEWKIWKSRFAEATGYTFHTGFEKGKFVPYDDEFKRKADTWRSQRAWNETVGKNVFKDNKEGSNE